MATQIIRGPDGNPAFAVLPWDEYRALVPDAADAALSDEELFDRADAMVPPRRNRQRQVPYCKSCGKSCVLYAM